MFISEEQTDYILGLTHERPSWEKQVQSMEDVHPGQILVMTDKYHTALVLIVRSAYPGKKNQWLFRYTNWSTTAKNRKIFAVSCADYGLTDYGNGKWNRDSRLIKTCWPDMPKFILKHVVNSTIEDSSSCNW